MKLIIDISYGLKDVYEHRNVTALDVEEMKRALQNGTPIPDNATNDDVLKALFDERGYIGIHDRMMHTKWLFAPYQKGGK